MIGIDGLLKYKCRAQDRLHASVKGLVAGLLCNARLALACWNIEFSLGAAFAGEEAVAS